MAKRKSTSNPVTDANNARIPETEVTSKGTKVTHTVTHEGGDRKVLTPDEIRAAEAKAAAGQ